MGNLTGNRAFLQRARWNVCVSILEWLTDRCEGGLESTGLLRSGEELHT